MKAASLLRHIWVGCFICGLFLAATGVAYAGANTNGTNGKADNGTKQELSLKQEDPGKKKVEAVSVSNQGTAAKAEAKPAEVKKEEANTGMFSFNFLYYLFYKTNFAESTNNALRASWNAFIDRLLD